MKVWIAAITLRESQPEQYTIRDMSRRPLIALLTDFGTRDPYVAEVKCVLAALADAEIIDLTHEIAPFDVFEAAMFVRTVWPSFSSMQRRVVILAVVDPGVGSERRILAMRDGDRFLLVPDNGLAHPILNTVREVRSVEDSSRSLPERSATFHGRDRFAPMAAALANGFPFGKVGPLIIDPAEVVPLAYKEPRYDGAEARGTVISIDRFGNLITDVESARLGSSTMAATVRGTEILAVSRTYLDAPADGAFLIPGSRGTMEISVRNGSAAALLQIARGEQVIIRFLS